MSPSPPPPPKKTKKQQTNKINETSGLWRKKSIFTKNVKKTRNCNVIFYLLWIAFALFHLR